LSFFFRFFKIHSCHPSIFFFNKKIFWFTAWQRIFKTQLDLLLEFQDLQTFVVLPDSYPANVKKTMSQFANLDKADWILINTFYKLECQVGDFVPHNWTSQLFVLLFRFLGKSHSFSIPSQSYLRQYVPPFKNCNVLFSFVSFGYWRRQIYIV
jgi:hypothetical protein